MKSIDSILSPSLIIGTVLALSILVLSASAQEPPKNSQHEDPIVSDAKHATSSEVNDLITREQAAAILVELRAIRELLQKQGSQERLLFVPTDQLTPEGYRGQVQFRIARHSPSMGQEDAPITLLEFIDYQCPFCRGFHSDIFPLMKKEYIDTGKVRYINLDLPLAQHSEANATAEATRCAGDQGKYWEFRSAILTEQHTLSSNSLLDTARFMSLNFEVFRNCLSSHLHEREIEEDSADAASLHIDATPAFVIGKATDGKLEGALLVGAISYPILRAKIEELLNERKP